MLQRFFQWFFRTLRYLTERKQALCFVLLLLYFASLLEHSSKGKSEESAYPTFFSAALEIV